MNIISIIENAVVEGVQHLYGASVPADKVTLSPTRKEFEGDYTVVVFPFTKAAKKKPEQIGEELGQYLVDHCAELVGFNVIKGFLNLVVSDAYWQNYLLDIARQDDYAQHAPNGQKVMVEFSSPNTNKPLHLGHIRNILLGWATARIHEAAGYEVIKVQVINDRGIAICKSMLAWRKYGEGETPETSGIKGDHLVGKYYVLFERKFQEEYSAWQQSATGQEMYEARKKEDEPSTAFFKRFKNTYFNEHSQLGQEAKDMLLAWETGDPMVIELWNTMNGWVYQGFDETYRRLGVNFDKLYYESQTYLLGKGTIQRGLEQDIFFRKEDGSVWIDLQDVKLDQKLVLRSDGTSVYMTQDIGTAQLRYEDYSPDKMVYVVADEQNYHFQVLFETLKKLQAPYADGLHHLSYGMVDLPTGKMKSREGTVVDADDLIAEVIAEAHENSKERGTLADLPSGKQEDILRRIGLAALKFFIIKVQPRKRMTFDPKESVDMQGQTGPYVQNAFVRIRSVLRKAEKEQIDRSQARNYTSLEIVEKDLIAKVFDLPGLIREAAEQYDPSAIANYCYDLAKAYHKYYHDHSILRADSPEAVAFRLELSTAIAAALQKGMDLLGIEMPERM